MYLVKWRILLREGRSIASKTVEAFFIFVMQEIIMQTTSHVSTQTCAPQLVPCLKIPTQEWRKWLSTQKWRGEDSKMEPQRALEPRRHASGIILVIQRMNSGWRMLSTYYLYAYLCYLILSTQIHLLRSSYTPSPTMVFFIFDCFDSISILFLVVILRNVYEESRTQMKKTCHPSFSAVVLFHLTRNNPSLFHIIWSYIWLGRIKQSRQVGKCFIHINQSIGCFFVDVQCWSYQSTVTCHLNQLWLSFWIVNRFAFRNSYIQYKYCNLNRIWKENSE